MPLRGGGREVRRAGFVCSPRPENQRQRRRIRRSSKQYFSLCRPLMMARTAASVASTRLDRLDAIWGSRVYCVGLIQGGFTPRLGTTTLWIMDSVRFGRALGVGARAAAKTIVTAVDAAKAPNPSAGAKGKEAARGDGAAGATTGKAEGYGARLGKEAARTTARVGQAERGLKEGSRRFSQAVGGRVVKLSGVLWLELTGVFFGVFALFAANGAWKLRAAITTTAANHDAHVRFLIAATMAAIFGYFCISSFVKAAQRGRRS